jgi:hypothetical protein
MLAGVGVTLVFENNRTTGPGNHKLEVTGTANFEITRADGTFPIPKQPSQAGVGANPWFSFGIQDHNGTWIVPPIILGRCVQGFSAHYSQDFGLPASAAAVFGALDCNDKGPSVTVGAPNSTHGIDGTLLLDNNKNKAIHEIQAAVKLQVTLAPPVTIPKQGNVGGPAGNPILLVGFTGTGNPTLTDLGRCNKLGGCSSSCSKSVRGAPGRATSPPVVSASSSRQPEGRKFGFRADFKARELPVIGAARSPQCSLERAETDASCAGPGRPRFAWSNLASRTRLAPRLRRRKRLMGSPPPAPLPLQRCLATSPSKCRCQLRVREPLFQKRQGRPRMVGPVRHPRYC